jgi:hypothetical protein
VGFTCVWWVRWAGRLLGFQRFSVLWSVTVGVGMLHFHSPAICLQIQKIYIFVDRIRCVVEASTLAATSRTVQFVSFCFLCCKLCPITSTRCSFCGYCRVRKIYARATTSIWWRRHWMCSPLGGLIGRSGR